MLIAEPKPSALGAALGDLDNHPIYAEVAEQAGVLLYSDGWSSVLSDPDLKSDPVHANGAGFEKFATDLYAWLRKQGFL